MDKSNQRMNAGPKFQLPTDRAPNPEEVALYIKNNPELQKPLWFPNHQKQFAAFTWLSCAGIPHLSFALPRKLFVSLAVPVRLCLLASIHHARGPIDLKACFNSPFRVD